MAPVDKDLTPDTFPFPGFNQSSYEVFYNPETGRRFYVGTPYGCRHRPRSFDAQELHYRAIKDLAAMCDAFYGGEGRGTEPRPQPRPAAIQDLADLLATTDSYNCLELRTVMDRWREGGFDEFGGIFAAMLQVIRLLMQSNAAYKARGRGMADQLAIFYGAR